MPRAEVVTSKRRELIVAVLRRQSEPKTCSELVRELTATHERGEWPQAEWPGARNEPYSVGVQQHLRRLVASGLIAVTVDRGLYVYWAPMPEDLLPDPRWAEPLLLAYKERTGFDAIVGVTSQYMRVVRVATARGEFEHVLEPDETWPEALAATGLVDPVLA